MERPTDINDRQKMIKNSCFYKNSAYICIILLHIDGCRSICKDLDKNKKNIKRAILIKLMALIFLHKFILKINQYGESTIQLGTF